MLIAARVLMGAGAAAVMPTTLSVITTSFPPEERGRAVGVWVGVAGGGAVIGLFGSGILLEFFSWNSFFALNVTLAVLALIGTVARDPDLARGPAGPARRAGRAAVPGRRRQPGVRDHRGRRPRLDLGRHARRGAPSRWSRWSGSCCASCARPTPLLDVRLFRLRGFSAGSLSVTAQFFAAFGFFFVVLQYLQFVVGRSPLEAALTLLPLPFVLLPSARLRPAAGRAVRHQPGRRRRADLDRRRPRGHLAARRASSTTVTFYAGLVLFGVGMGLAGTPGDHRDHRLAAASASRASPRR